MLVEEVESPSTPAAKRRQQKHRTTPQAKRRRGAKAQAEAEVAAAAAARAAEEEEDDEPDRLVEEDEEEEAEAVADRMEQDGKGAEEEEEAMEEVPTRCEKDPQCRRGYRHGGKGGVCSTFVPMRRKPADVLCSGCSMILDKAGKTIVPSWKCEEAGCQNWMCKACAGGDAVDDVENYDVYCSEHRVAAREEGASRQDAEEDGGRVLPSPTPTFVEEGQDDDEDDEQQEFDDEQQEFDDDQEGMEVIDDAVEEEEKDEDEQEEEQEEDEEDEEEEGDDEEAEGDDEEVDAAVGLQARASGQPDLETSSDADSRSNSRSNSRARADEDANGASTECRGHFVYSQAEIMIKRLAELSPEEKELLKGANGARAELDEGSQPDSRASARAVLEQGFGKQKWAKQLIPGFLGLGKFTDGGLKNERPAAFGKSIPMCEDPAGEKRKAGLNAQALAHLSNAKHLLPAASHVVLPPAVLRLWPSQRHRRCGPHSGRLWCDCCVGIQPRPQHLLLLLAPRRWDDPVGLGDHPFRRPQGLPQAVRCAAARARALQVVQPVRRRQREPKDPEGDRPQLGPDERVEELVEGPRQHCARLGLASAKGFQPANLLFKASMPASIQSAESGTRIPSDSEHFTSFAALNEYCMDAKSEMSCKEVPDSLILPWELHADDRAQQNAESAARRNAVKMGLRGEAFQLAGKSGVKRVSYATSEDEVTADMLIADKDFHLLTVSVALVPEWLRMNTDAAGNRLQQVDSHSASGRSAAGSSAAGSSSSEPCGPVAGGGDVVPQPSDKRPSSGRKLRCAEFFMGSGRLTKVREERGSNTSHHTSHTCPSRSHTFHRLPPPSTASPHQALVQYGADVFCVDRKSDAPEYDDKYLIRPKGPKLRVGDAMKRMERARMSDPPTSFLEICQCRDFKRVKDLPYDSRQLCPELLASALLVSSVIEPRLLPRRCAERLTTYISRRTASRSRTWAMGGAPPTTTTWANRRLAKSTTAT